MCGRYVTEATLAILLLYDGLRRIRRRTAAIKDDELAKLSHFPQRPTKGEGELHGLLDVSLNLHKLPL